MSIIIPLLLCLLLVQPIKSWQEWHAKSHTLDTWKKLWVLGEGPALRSGHSLVLFNQSQIVLFGGRGNDAHRPHVPKHFHVEEDGGVLDFTTHDDKPLSSAYSPDSVICQPVEQCISLTNASSGNEEVCSYSWENLLQGNLSATQQAKIEEVCGFVSVGVWYNDVWMYDTDCLRYADDACDDGWRILHSGIQFGGCNNENGVLVCDTPSERWGHGATMLDESTMAVYGGYSHECEDYCDDFWLFDLHSLQWTQVERSSLPGNRWKFSMVSDSERIYLFGGHRLWHGFSSDNNAENRWQSTELLPKGGYLDDLWVYGDHSDNGVKQWTKVEGQMTCVDAPGLTWESRHDTRCEIHWPSARSGHAAVYDEKRGGMWIHGGFSTYYPYPTSKDSGSGFGTRTLGREHVGLHPTYAFYLDDLWFYDIESGLWEKKRICECLM